MRGIFRAGRFAIAYVRRLPDSGSTLRACTQNLLTHILRQALRGTYALTRSGGGVRSRWSLTSTAYGLYARRAAANAMRRAGPPQCSLTLEGRLRLRGSKHTGGQALIKASTQGVRP